MTQERANGRRYDRAALTIGLACVLVTLAAALVVEWRWRTGREVAANVPLPRMGRLVATEPVPEPDPGPVPRPICAHEVEVPGHGVGALEAYGALLVEYGWQAREGEPAAAVPALGFRHGPRRLTVALLDSDRDPGAWARLRVRIRPCD